MMSAGLDSLAAVELRNMVQQRFSVPLSATAAFDYPTIKVRAGQIPQSPCMQLAQASAMGVLCTNKVWPDCPLPGK